MEHDGMNGRKSGDMMSNGTPGPSRSHGTQSPSPSTSATKLGYDEQVYHQAEAIQQPAPGIVNNTSCLDHLYQNGFRLGHWADTVLHIQGHAYNMHALLLGRSPYLAHLMSTTPLVQSNGNGPLRSIYVPIEHEPEITSEAFILAVGYLYSSVALSGISPANARAVLAAGCFLGGVDDLCNVAYETCRSSISLENIEDWLQFIQRTGLSEEPTSGRATPTSPPPPQSPTFRGPFVTYTARLRQDVIHFLIVDLPSLLKALPSSRVSSDGGDGLETLKQVYAHVPFDIFKKAVESPSFEIGNDQTRFRFAKSVIELRKKPGNNAYVTGADETVVLAFGAMSGGGSNVHVTRKVKKKALWKVSA